MAVKVKKITYTPANIFAMFATPQVVLSAPAAGYVNNILGISHDMVYNSAVYTVATSLLYGYNSSLGSNVYNEPNILITAGDVNLPAGIGIAFNGGYSTTKDFKVTTDAAAATGDSDIDVYIIYETKLLDV